MRPTTSPSESHTRSRRRGRRTSEPSTATMTASDTRPVTTRFANSMFAWTDRDAPEVRWPFVQFGQSGQPSPEPVSRTAAPVTMIAARRIAATRVIWR